MTPAITSRMLVRNAAKTPLGRITLSGYMKGSPGLPDHPMRVLGSYALVYVVGGGGVYRDLDRTLNIVAGDLILVFPEIPHTYHKNPGGHWDEIYIVFDGPVFDLWRKEGLIDPSRPRFHLEPIDYWLRRLDEIVTRPGTSRLGTSLEQVCLLQHFLADVLELAERSQRDEGKAWLQDACDRLRRCSGSDEDVVRRVADDLGISYETFRKRFVRLAGVPPKRYRMQCTIEEVCHLLRQPNLPLRTVAERAGFCDEFHLSRRFKQLMGVSPSDFRRQLGVAT